jgi:hypothetical protein
MGRTHVSDPTNPDSSARRERGGAIYRSPIGDTLIFKAFPDANATPCQSHILPDQSVPVYWIVAFVHTHPFHDGDILPTNDPTCTKKAGAVYAYDAVTTGGPSTDDWNAQNSGEQVPDGPGLGSYHSVPFYVVDADNIYRGDTGTKPSDRWRTPKFKRSTGSCTVF